MQKYKTIEKLFYLFYVYVSCCFNLVVCIKGYITPFCFAFSFSLGQYPKPYHTIHCFYLSLFRYVPVYPT